jgi:hypothetical protein
VKKAVDEFVETRRQFRMFHLTTAQAVVIQSAS